MGKYCAQAFSRNDLKQLAFLIRKKFGYADNWMIPVDRLLDQMCDAFEEFSYEVIPDDEWDDPSAHAVTDVTDHNIRIRESIYIRACDGKGRDRMTVAHEIAHYMLICIVGVKLCSCRNNKIEPYKDPEWQAKCLAAELLMPYSKLIKRRRKPSAESLARLCGVSVDAAKYQLKYVNRGDHIDCQKQKTLKSAE